MKKQQDNEPSWEKYEVQMVGNITAVVSTRYWVDAPCDQYCATDTAPCRHHHRKFNPHGEPEAKKQLLMFTRCETAWGCEGKPPHTHDVAGQEEYEFPFAEYEDTSDDDWERVPKKEDWTEPMYVVLKSYKSTAVIRTRYWKFDQGVLCFAPQERQAEERLVCLWRCYDCENDNPHTHCTYRGGGRETYVFPYPEAGYPTTEEIAMRYTVKSMEASTVEITTPFWAVLGGKTIFRPFEDPQPTTRTLSLGFCSKEDCYDKENTHTHDVYGNIQSSHYNSRHVFGTWR